MKIENQYTSLTLRVVPRVGSPSTWLRPEEAYFLSILTPLMSGGVHLSRAQVEGLRDELNQILETK